MADRRLNAVLLVGWAPARRAFAVAALSVALPLAARADEQAPAAPAAAPQFPPEAFAAIGSSFAVSNHLPELGWNDEQVAAFVTGIKAAFAGKPYPFDDAAKQASAEMGRRVQEIEALARQRAVAAPDKLEQFMRSTSKRLNLEQSDSGLWYSILTVGRGDRPGAGDSVVLSCLAVAADGQTKLPELSSASFRVRVADLMPGLREGVQMMAVGSQGTFLVPPKLSFGDGQWPPSVEKGAPILFQVTLHEVVRDAPVK